MPPQHHAHGRGFFVPQGFLVGAEPMAQEVGQRIDKRRYEPLGRFKEGVEAEGYHGISTAENSALDSPAEKDKVPALTVAERQKVCEPDERGGVINVKE